MADEKWGNTICFLLNNHFVTCVSSSRGSSSVRGDELALLGTLRLFSALNLPFVAGSPPFMDLPLGFAPTPSCCYPPETRHHPLRGSGSSPASGRSYKKAHPIIIQFGM